MLTGVHRRRLEETGNSKHKENIIFRLRCIVEIFTNSADSTEFFAVEFELILLVEAALLTMSPDDHHISRNVVVRLVTPSPRSHEPHHSLPVLLPGVGAEKVVVTALQRPDP